MAGALHGRLDDGVGVGVYGRSRRCSRRRSTGCSKALRQSGSRRGWGRRSQARRPCRRPLPTPSPGSACPSRSRYPGSGRCWRPRLPCRSRQVVGAGGGGAGGGGLVPPPVGGGVAAGAPVPEPIPLAEQDTQVPLTSGYWSSTTGVSATGPGTLRSLRHRDRCPPPRLGDRLAWFGCVGTGAPPTIAHE
jgi:hypothetical protein